MIVDEENFGLGRKSDMTFGPGRKITGSSSRDKIPGRNFLGTKFRPPKESSDDLIPVCFYVYHLDSTHC
jgi:hypothetical protein